MIAKCESCGFIRISRQRATCPTLGCKRRLTRPSLAELNDIGESAMYRSRASRCLIESMGMDRESSGSHEQQLRCKAFRLAAFMWAVHGRKLSNAEARRMLD